MKLLRKITDKTAGILTLYFSISILIVLNLLQQLFLKSLIINVILSTILILNTAILAYDSLTTNRFMERVISFFKNSDKSNIDYFSIKGSGKFEVFAENINLFIDNSVKHSKEQQNYLQSISEMAERITESTREVGKSIEQVTATIYEIAKGSSEQSTSMQETAELIEMVSEAIEEVTRNSNQVGRDAGKSAELIGESKAVVDDLQINTKHIVEITEQISLTTNEMNNKSEAINGIVKIITSIASQTNLLALNAAIEAARAGEAGKGFSVVAAEIRSLAEQSSKSANEIASIISNSLNDTKQVTEKMKEATAIIESQVGIIDKIDEVFSGMADTVNNFARKMKSSGNTLEEVNNAITEINNQAQNVASIIESNAAATEEVSAASQEQQGIFESIADQISSLAEMSKVK